MKLAIFDFDGTLFPHQSIPYLLKCYKKMGYNKIVYIIFWIKILWIAFKYKLPLIKNYTKKEFRKDAAISFIQMFNGKTDDELEEFFSQCVTYIMKDLNPSVIEELKKAQEEGYYTVLLSGCLKDVLTGVAKNLNIDNVIGTEIKISNTEKNKFKHKDFDIIMGSRKSEKLLEVIGNRDIDWKNSVAYGDSSYDENILRLVGKPVAVNPDAELKTIAEKNGWTILQN